MSVFSPRRRFMPALMLSVALFAFPACAADKAAATSSPTEGERSSAPSLEMLSALAKPEPLASVNADNAETYRLLKLFGDVFEKTRSHYVEPVTDQKLIDAALNGMLSNLDPHSSYMNADETRDKMVQMRGEFGGLGIEVTMENNAIKVVSPIDDTPASQAGIKAGDLIVALDGKPVMGLSLQEAVNKMRGASGSKIKLTIVRKGAAEPLDITITRAVIKVQSVKWRREGNIGYIRISSFTEKTQEGLDKALVEFKRDMGDKIEGYVLDLRNNPGGLLDQAVSVSDTFLQDGVIVSTRGREKDDVETYNAEAGDATSGKPVVVLINSGSASASEIVSGALQDHHRAVIMGTKSFGKGSVQSVIQMRGGGTMLLTTARYYTPSGRSIQAEGIVPDVVVEQAKIEPLDHKGLEVHEADLKGALQNDQLKGQSAQEAASPYAPAAKPADGEANKEAAVDKAEDDYQLTRALDLIHGLALFGGKAVTAQPVPATTAEAKP